MKTKITLLFFILIFSGISITYAQTISLRHYATEENTDDLDEALTVIDHPQLNNNPNFVTTVQKARIDSNGTVINNPYHIGITYDGLLNRWVIYNEDSERPMNIGTCYNVMAVPTEENWATKFKCTSTVEGFPSACSVDFEPMNDNSQARCLWSRTRDSDNVPMDFPIESYYTWTNPGVWYISTLSFLTLPLNVTFNIICNPIGFSYYEHNTTSNNVFGYANSLDDYAYWTPIDHEDLNGNPNAMVFIQHRREPAGGYVYRSHSVQYDTNTFRWQIHLELPEYVSGIDNFPAGRFYDVYYKDGTLSTDENTVSTATLFPNPTNKTFNIQAQNPITEVILFNILGQRLDVINGNGTQDLEIDISEYNAGHYFAKVKIGERIQTLRLVKN